MTSSSVVKCSLSFLHLIKHMDILMKLLKFKSDHVFEGQGMGRFKTWKLLSLARITLDMKRSTTIMPSVPA